METQNQNFNIQFVANITGINPHTIRAWEKRYEAIKPERDHNGRRLYNSDDIERLTVLNNLVKMGNSISDIAALSSEELQNIGEQYSHKVSQTQKSKVNFDYQNTLKSINMALEFFKLDVINHELAKAAQDLSSLDFALRIASPLLTKIREIKQANKLTREQRTQVYLILKSDLIKKIYQTRTFDGVKKKVVIAAAPGDLNELGSMLVTILFLEKGYEVDFLGGNVDEDALGKITAQFKPDILFIGLNYSHIDTGINKDQYLSVVNQHLTSKTRLMIGAYDVCFKVPNIDDECILDFNDLFNKI